jgi:hypothetical protein
MRAILVLISAYMTASTLQLALKTWSTEADYLLTDIASAVTLRKKHGSTGTQLLANNAVNRFRYSRYYASFNHASDAVSKELEKCRDSYMFGIRREELFVAETTQQLAMGGNDGDTTVEILKVMRNTVLNLVAVHTWIAADLEIGEAAERKAEAAAARAVWMATTLAGNRKRRLAKSEKLAYVEAMAARSETLPKIRRHSDTAVNEAYAKWRVADNDFDVLMMREAQEKLVRSLVGLGHAATSSWAEVYSEARLSEEAEVAALRNVERANDYLHGLSMFSCQKGIPGAFEKFTIALDEWRKLHAESVQRGIALDRTLRKIVIYQWKKSRVRLVLKEQGKMWLGGTSRAPRGL